MSLPTFRVITAPEEEPVTVAEVKINSRIDHDNEDSLIEGFIATARAHCEDVNRRAFVTQTLEVTLDQWPHCDYIQLPRPPLISITHVKYIDSLGAENIMSASDYFADVANEPGRLCLAYGADWPTATLRPYAAITIRYVAGFGEASDVPARYKQAIMAYVGAYYENREAFVVQPGLTPVTLPFVDQWLMTDRAY